MTSTYRTALFCGAAPLITGTATFLLWAITRWELLEAVGMWVIVLGLFFFAAGCIALLIYLSEAPTTGLSRRAIWLRAVAAALLLLVNFPAAFAIVTAALAMTAGDFGLDD